MVKSTFFLQRFNAWVTITQRQLIKHVQIEETVFLEAVNVLMDLVENLVQVRIHYSAGNSCFNKGLCMM